MLAILSNFPMTELIAAVSAMFTAYIGLQMAKLNAQQKIREENTIIRELAVKQALEVSNRKAQNKLEEVKVTLENATANTEDKLGEVKVALENTTTNTEKKLDTIHLLVNSAMGTQLKVTAVALRALAENTGDPKHIAAAEIAEHACEEHDAKQKIVDAGGKILNTDI
jgi:hypothetical protein